MKKYDFSGWATKNDLRCSDGRTIRKNAFKDDDGHEVPLVWQHQHNSPENVLGHALLQNRENGVYAYGVFNNTEMGQQAKELVQNGDICSLSIYANQLQQRGGDVYHGSIKEVSLVLAGANPGALIDFPVLAHGVEAVDEAYIYTGEEISVKDREYLQHEDEDDEMVDEEPTVQDIYDDMTDEQKDVVRYIVEAALEEAAAEQEADDEEYEDEGENEDYDDAEDDGEDYDEEEDEEMKHNVFDTEEGMGENVLSHSEIDTIMEDAKRYGSLKESVLAHADDYGIEQIGWLFPEYKNQNVPPDFIKRDTGWVARVMNGVHHTPFSRIKSMFADITEDDARAKGYIKGNRKTHEVFSLLKRTTDPQTIYKKQKLDRDDIVDITDFDVVSWLKTEMRGMLDEEIARAILVGDGRLSSSEDKIQQDHIRSIWQDDDLYAIHKTLTAVSGEAEAKTFIKTVLRSWKEYKGSGNCVLFTTEDMLTELLLLEDTQGHFMYPNKSVLATTLRVSDIVTVPVMGEIREGRTDSYTHKTYYPVGIIVNLSDYNVGADKGGSVNMFDDFDIDYNQQKYLIETRCSGALTKPFSAIIIEKEPASPLVAFTVEPEAQTTNVLGKLVSALQGTDVTVLDHNVKGTLNYVTGYTGFSGDPDEQEGNYLALKVGGVLTTDTVTIELINGTVGQPVTLDDDRNFVIRITNKDNQKLRVVAKRGTTGTEVVRTYDLNRLVVKNA